MCRYEDFPPYDDEINTEHSVDCVYRARLIGEVVPIGASGCSCPGTVERQFIDEVHRSDPRRTQVQDAQP